MAKDYRFEMGAPKAGFQELVKGSRGVDEGLGKGVQFLMKKNKIEVIMGNGKLKPGKKVAVTGADGKVTEYSANHILVATGGRSRELPALKQDGKKILGYRDAMVLPSQPKSMVIVGSGAIGSEFAYFHACLLNTSDRADHLSLLGLAGHHLYSNTKK